MRIGSLALALLVGCGDGADNVAACEAWLEAIECGDFDFSSAVTCSAYEGTTCDISGYFDCLTENTVCDEGVPDMSGWSTCAAEAVCE